MNAQSPIYILSNSSGINLVPPVYNDSSIKTLTVFFLPWWITVISNHKSQYTLVMFYSTLGYNLHDNVVDKMAGTWYSNEALHKHITTITHNERK